MKIPTSRRVAACSLVLIFSLFGFAQTADLYRQAAANERNAAAQCPEPGRSCHLRMAGYYDCIAAQLRSSGGSCNQPTCNGSCSSGAASYSPTLVAPTATANNTVNNIQVLTNSVVDLFSNIAAQRQAKRAQQEMEASQQQQRWAEQQARIATQQARLRSALAQVDQQNSNAQLLATVQEDFAPEADGLAQQVSLDNLDNQQNPAPQDILPRISPDGPDITPDDPNWRNVYDALQDSEDSSSVQQLQRAIAQDVDQGSTENESAVTPSGNTLAPATPNPYQSSSSSGATLAASPIGGSSSSDNSPSQDLISHTAVQTARDWGNAAVGTAKDLGKAAVESLVPNEASLLDEASKQSGILDPVRDFRDSAESGLSKLLSSSEQETKGSSGLGSWVNDKIASVGVDLAINKGFDQVAKVSCANLPDNAENLNCQTGQAGQVYNILRGGSVASGLYAQGTNMAEKFYNQLVPWEHGGDSEPTQ